MHVLLHRLADKLWIWVLKIADFVRVTFATNLVYQTQG
jgi:hypothetical protein